MGLAKAVLGPPLCVLGPVRCGEGRRRKVWIGCVAGGVWGRVKRRRWRRVAAVPGVGAAHEGSSGVLAGGQRAVSMTKKKIPCERGVLRMREWLSSGRIVGRRIVGSSGVGSSSSGVRDR